MASHKTRTSTRSETVLEKVREHLDELSTQEAQVLRMHFGITEPADAAVGECPPGCPAGTEERAREIETRVKTRVNLARNKASSGEPKTKDKIVGKLRKKS